MGEQLLNISGVLIKYQNISIGIVIVSLIILYAFTIYFNFKDNEKLKDSKLKELELLEEHNDYHNKLVSHIESANCNLNRLKTLSKYKKSTI